MNASGLSTDIFFIMALKSNDELMATLPAHDIYNNVAYPDIDMENVALPYIIVNNDGGQNLIETKDDTYESAEDRVNISVRIAAVNRKQLDELASAVRKTVYQFITDMDAQMCDGEQPEGHELKPDDYELSFSDIAYIPDKPCCQVMLYYLCQVLNNLHSNDNDEQ